MERVNYLSCIIENITNTPAKRHLTGGIMVSLSMFFGGLAFTIITLKGEPSNE